MFVCLQFILLQKFKFPAFIRFIACVDCGKTVKDTEEKKQFKLSDSNNNFGLDRHESLSVVIILTLEQFWFADNERKNIESVIAF